MVQRTHAIRIPTTVLCRAAMLEAWATIHSTVKGIGYMCLVTRDLLGGSA